MIKPGEMPISARVTTLSLEASGVLGSAAAFAAVVGDAWSGPLCLLVLCDRFAGADFVFALVEAVSHFLSLSLSFSLSSSLFFLRLFCCLSAFPLPLATFDFLSWTFGLAPLQSWLLAVSPPTFVAACVDSSARSAAGLSFPGMPEAAL